MSPNRACASFRNYFSYKFLCLQTWIQLKTDHFGNWILTNIEANHLGNNYHHKKEHNLPHSTTQKEKIDDINMVDNKRNPTWLTSSGQLLLLSRLLHTL